ncbi:MAG TPA: hypothetical protein VIU12_35305 [Chryseolinea sp.]
MNTKEIRSKEDFIKFVGDLILDLKTNPNTWENKNLDDYLEALQRWTGDMEGYYINNNLPVPENVNWRIFADILMAARMYE